MSCSSFEWPWLQLLMQKCVSFLNQYGFYLNFHDKEELYPSFPRAKAVNCAQQLVALSECCHGEAAKQQQHNLLGLARGKLLITL